MALVFENSLSGLAQLDLWYRVTNNNNLYLSDITSLIPYRWLYFKNNWENIKDTYIANISTYSDPKLLQLQIDDFTQFIDLQRNSLNTKNPFDNSDIISRFFTIFDITDINSVNLSHEERLIVKNKKAEVRAYTRGDFLVIREKLQNERDQMADKVGTTDADYNRVFIRSPISARVNINNKDVNNMYQLQEAIKSVDFILANSFSLKTAFIDPFALATANAKNPNINIKTYRSGFLVKLNYGEDLQALAKRTLGDPDKWIDIAITNGLKPPYIDEVGESILLISSANGNQINISGVDSNSNPNIDKISIGQVILLQSNVQTFPEQRTVQNITQVPISGEIIIELSGDSDLDRYRLADNSHIRVFKQNTINSSFYIMIPSTNQLDDTQNNDTPWFLQGSDGTNKRQKVDLNLDENGDLNFDSTNDIQLSFGLSNAIQALKLKMTVEAGELRRHPEFGLVAVQGLTNANIKLTKKLLTESITKMIQVDERFAGINSLNISYGTSKVPNSASIININLVVKLVGSNQLLPITFSINKG